MEFLTIYDVTRVAKELHKEKVIDFNGYEKYFIQQDTHDFHIFRILKGNYDEENEFGEWADHEDGYTVERENIDKYDVAEILMGDEMEYKRSVRDIIIDTTSDLDLFKAVLIADENQGYANYDYFVYDDAQECINRKVSENGDWTIIEI